MTQVRGQQAHFHHPESDLFLTVCGLSGMSGNLLIDRLLGAHLHLVSPQAYAKFGFMVRVVIDNSCCCCYHTDSGAQELVNELVKQLAESGHKPYGIPVRQGRGCNCCFVKSAANEGHCWLPACSLLAGWWLQCYRQLGLHDLRGGNCRAKSRDGALVANDLSS